MELVVKAVIDALLVLRVDRDASLRVDNVLKV
jgi:hypothetical protein